MATENNKILAPGTAAPDFSLHSTPDQLVSLSDFRGAPLIVAFYPADWSPVCGDQMALYNEVLPEFHKFKAAIVGISVDGSWCHAAFARTASCTFRCWRISSQRAGSRASTALIAITTASASGRSS